MGKITEVLACHPATNRVMHKSNMAAAVHYEHLILIFLFRVYASVIPLIQLMLVRLIHF